MSEYKRLTEKVFTHDDGSSEYDCDASVRATNNRLGQLEDKIEETTGFHVLDHELKFYGQCKECQKRGRKIVR